MTGVKAARTSNVIMKVSLVRTVIGHDKPGIVEALARTVASAGANWEESRMARLANRFAGILRVSAPEERADELSRALERLSEHGLRIVIEKSDLEESAQAFRRVELELVGNDRPGIVREISRALVERGVNIEELHTECSSAPMSGGVLFKAHAQLRTPPGVRAADLQNVLESLAND